MKHKTGENGKYLVVGLGNPDLEFENTPHNIGFNVVNQIAEEKSLSWKKSKTVLGDFTKFKFQDKEIILLKPLTYMNKSGMSVKNALNFWKINLNNLLVVQDDSDVEMGRLKISFGQSSGGHKGLENIIQTIGNQQFSRIKLGIRPEKPKNIPITKHIKAEKFVLRRYPEKKLEIISMEGAQAVYFWIENSLSKAMSKYNGSNYNFKL